MRILITGGSSFLGAHLVLRGRSVAPQLELIPLHNRTPLAIPGGSRACDLSRDDAAATLRELKPDAIVHLACKVIPPRGMSGAALHALNRRLLETVLAVQVPVVYASSTVVHWPDGGAYRTIRLEEEARVVGSGLPYAILRPCAPYGPFPGGHRPSHRESFHTLARAISRLPVVPIPGDGQYRRQPIHAEDFADAILALLRARLPDRAFDAGGAQALTFDALVLSLASALEKKRRLVHVPVSWMARGAALLPNLDPALVRVLTTDDVADPAALAQQTGVKFRSFEDGVACLRGVV